MTKARMRTNHDGQETIGCPRREELSGSPFKLPPAEADHWRRDKTCSHCGSLNPDFFMDQLKAGAMLIGSDKNYKVYLKYHNPRAGRRRVESEETYAGFLGFRVTRRTWGREPEYIEHKFYWQHLSSDQQKEFIELYNAEKINLEPLDGLYVAPYFCERASR